MPNKLKVLMLFEEKDNGPLDYKILMGKFDLSPDAAFHWLSRLHRQGLIKLTSKRGGKFYTLTEKGEKRLRWLRRNKRNEKEASGLDWLFDDNKRARQKETVGSFLFGKK